MKHTQGEWVAKQSQSQIKNFCIWSLAPNGVMRKNVAMIYEHHAAGQNNILEEEAKANAKLIAAAPDLLKALQKIIAELNDSITNYLDVKKLATEAIQKATS